MGGRSNGPGWSDEHTPTKRVIIATVAEVTRLLDSEQQTAIDLTAGSGNHLLGKTPAVRWQEGCSPGILSAHAMRQVANNRRITDVRLCEQDQKAYDKLLPRLETELPRLHNYKAPGVLWHMDTNDDWTALSDRNDAFATLKVEPGSSDRFHYALPKDGDVLLVQDPNSFFGWTMGEKVFESVEKSNIRYLTTVSAIGFNGGRGSARNRMTNPDKWNVNVDLLYRLIDVPVGYDVILIPRMGVTPGKLAPQGWVYLVTIHDSLAGTLVQRLKDRQHQMKNVDIIPLSIRGRDFNYWLQQGLKEEDD